MAAASYSSYNRTRAPAKKKPSLVKARISVGSFVAPKPKVSAPSLKKPTAKPKAAAAGPVMPPAPVTQAVPTIAASGPPPQSLQSASDRADIAANYGLGISDINRGIMSAALAYGGVDNVNQFGLDDSTNAVGVTHNPDDNSALSVIARNQAAVGKNIDESAGAQNTFFSSNRLNDLQNTSSEADRQRAQAKADYDKAMADYTSNVLGMREVRDSGLRNASIADIMAAQANAPVAEAAAPPDPGNPMGASPAQQAVKAAGHGPKPGFQFVQDSGSRAGLSYNLVMHNGTYWRRYENGDLVPR